MNKELLVIKSSRPLSNEQREVCLRVLEPLAEQLGVMCTVLDGGLDAELHRDHEPLLTEMLEEQRKGNEEQRKTNQLLLMLIEAMGEEDSDPDDEAQTYMDGTPVAQ